MKKFIPFVVLTHAMLSAKLEAQALSVMPPRFAGPDSVLLECLDPQFSEDRVYEVWRSPDLAKWELENFYFGRARAMQLEIPGAPDEREFFQVRVVDQTADGSGAQGSVAAPRDATFPSPEDSNSPKVALGRLLFWDKELSGNRDISCATCHQPALGTGDSLALPVGTGGRGLGTLRSLGFEGIEVQERVPRNAPPLFALGHQSIEVLFHDGRLFRDPSEPSGFRTPAGESFPAGIESLLAAQAMFPVTSAVEMAGKPGDNEIADFAATGNLPAVWEALAKRLREIPEYLLLFQQVYPEIESAADLEFVHAANAIGAFEALAFRANRSPFDQFLQGDRSALSPRQLRGMKLFYGPANCATCHSGPLQTDQQFHAIAMPQLGPGKGHGPTGREDWGRFAVTGDPADKLKFRTPTLRNVDITGPYGHSGAYATLEGVVRHHLDPTKALEEYDPAQLLVPSRPDLDEIDVLVMNDPMAKRELIEANELGKTILSDEQIGDLMEFLRSLTDMNRSGLLFEAPRNVPSGLPVED